MILTWPNAFTVGSTKRLAQSMLLLRGLTLSFLCLAAKPWYAFRYCFYVSRKSICVFSTSGSFNTWNSWLTIWKDIWDIMRKLSSHMIENRSLEFFSLNSYLISHDYSCYCNLREKKKRDNMLQNNSCQSNIHLVPGWMKVLHYSNWFFWWLGAAIWFPLAGTCHWRSWRVNNWLERGEALLAYYCRITTHKYNLHPSLKFMKPFLMSSSSFYVSLAPEWPSGFSNFIG